MNNNIGFWQMNIYFDNAVIPFGNISAIETMKINSQKTNNTEIIFYLVSGDDMRITISDIVVFKLIQQFQITATSIRHQTNILDMVDKLDFRTGHEQEYKDLYKYLCDLENNVKENAEQVKELVQKYLTPEQQQEFQANIKDQKKVNELLDIAKENKKKSTI